VTVVPAGTALLVDGGTDVLMTDFGVKPPAGLLGLLDTDPLTRVRFSLVVAAARATWRPRFTGAIRRSLSRNQSTAPAFYGRA
jgi:hypothetical protein